MTVVVVVVVLVLVVGGYDGRVAWAMLVNVVTKLSTDFSRYLFIQAKNDQVN